MTRSRESPSTPGREPLTERASGRGHRDGGILGRWAATALFLLVGFGQFVLPPSYALAAAALSLIVTTIVMRSIRFFLFTLMVTFPYAAGSYIAATQGMRFYPYAYVETYWQATELQLSSLLFVAALGTLSGIAARFTRALRRILDPKTSPWRVRDFALKITWAIVLFIGAHDYVVLVQNYAAIRSANRHNFDSFFIVGNGGIGITAALALTAILVYGVAVQREHRLVNVAFLMFLWGPKLLSGNRLYLLMGVAICELAFFCTCRSRPLRWLVGCGTALAVVGFFFLPTLWTPNPLIGLNEWIMPNSLFVSAISGVVTPHSVGVDPFWSRWVSLLYGPLRPYQPIDFSEAFTSLGLVNVGVGGNPWADLYTSAPWLIVVGFVLATLSLYAIGILLSRLSPVALLVTFALLIVWGRSLFWETLSVILYSAVLTWPAFAKRRSPEPESAPTPAPLSVEGAA